MHNRRRTDPEEPFVFPPWPDPPPPPKPLIGNTFDVADLFPNLSEENALDWIEADRQAAADRAALEAELDYQKRRDYGR